jgi:hypothetical protein
MHFFLSSAAHTVSSDIQIPPYIPASVFCALCSDAHCVGVLKNVQKNLKKIFKQTETQNIRVRKKRFQGGIHAFANRRFIFTRTGRASVFSNPDCTMA